MNLASAPGNAGNVAGPVGHNDSHQEPGRTAHRDRLSLNYIVKQRN